MQNAMGKETLAAPMYEHNPNHLYPQVHIVSNQMPISSNLSERLGNDPDLVYALFKVPLNFIASTHGNAPSTPSLFLNNSINGNARNTSFNGNGTNNDRNAPSPPRYFLSCNFIDKKFQK